MLTRATSIGPSKLFRDRNSGSNLGRLATSLRFQTAISILAPPSTDAKSSCDLSDVHTMGIGYTHRQPTDAAPLLGVLRHGAPLDTQVLTR